MCGKPSVTKLLKSPRTLMTQRTYRFFPRMHSVLLTLLHIIDFLLLHDKDVWRRCFSSDRTTIPVRVRDSIYNNYGEGRVEFLRNGQWISAYFYPWESPDARLFCKLLGYQYVWIHLPLINAWFLEYYALIVLILALVHIFRDNCSMTLYKLTRHLVLEKNGE